MADRIKANFSATLLQRILTTGKSGENCLNCFISMLKCCYFKKNRDS